MTDFVDTENCYLPEVQKLKERNPSYKEEKKANTKSTI